jgi:ribose transport system ATP-binding protein
MESNNKLNFKMDKEIILKTNGIGKKFGDNTVLRNIDLDVKKGECHAIVGENGAGKTTLMNILNGVVKPNWGDFYFNGEIIKDILPRESIKMGISVIHQEAALVPTLTVAENIFLSKLKGKFMGFIPNYKEIQKRSIEILKKLGESKSINVKNKVENLNSSKKQIVEIAKAISEDPKLLIMDEPTSSLTRKEVANLFRIIKDLKNEGISIIYISHILEEVFEIADRITVLRDGEYVGTQKAKESTIGQIISMMVGREINLYQKKQNHIKNESEVVLSIRNITKEPFFKDVSFDLKKGEILGFSGLVGSGRSELANAIFGTYGPIKGDIFLDGKRVNINSPKKAINMGIGMLPEDRKMQGFIYSLSIGKNISLANLHTLSNFGIISTAKERKMVNYYMKLLKIKAESTNSSIMSLSGGNQQKVVFAKWLATKAKLFIIDEPTRGIDVGTKSEIHNILRDLAKEGISIILISSELPEILSLSDRVIVMRLGRISGELKIEEANQENIMRLSAVGSK